LDIVEFELAWFSTSQEVLQAGAPTTVATSARPEVYGIASWLEVMTGRYEFIGRDDTLLFAFYSLKTRSSYDGRGVE
jgi:hypothetical protein